MREKRKIIHEFLLGSVEDWRLINEKGFITFESKYYC